LPVLNCWFVHVFISPIVHRRAAAGYDSHRHSGRRTHFRELCKVLILIACWLIIPANARQPSMVQTDPGVWGIFVQLLCFAAEKLQSNSFWFLCIDVQSSDPAESSVTSADSLRFVSISRSARSTSRIDV
jgi:hypothetical protein